MTDTHPGLDELRGLLLEMRQAIDEGLRIIGEAPEGGKDDERQS